MRRTRASLVILAASLILTACATTAGPSGPPPLVAPEPTPLPAAAVTLIADAPLTTDPAAQLQVEFFDEVAGFETPVSTQDMTAVGGGTWSADVTPPAGSVLYYRFVKTSGGRSVETDARGQPITARIGLVDGPTEIRQVIAGWEGDPPVTGTGRIVGTVFDALDGHPVPDILVTAGGRYAFTDGQGAFRIDDLVEGLHSLVALSPSGAYSPYTQGAIVAAESETPAALGLVAADPVVVTFQVTVPEDTPPGVPIRIAGNVVGLGDVFAQLAGGTTGSVGMMPALVMVDPTTYIGLAQLYRGTDLRYRYTLGDARWNSERDASGKAFTRHLVLGSGDVTLADVVSTWHDTAVEPVNFHVGSAVGVSPTDQVSVQFKGSEWTEPIPMWSAAPAEWRYTLFGPLKAGTPLEYRYCRNQQCGIADDIDTAGPQAAGRQTTPGPLATSVDDTVQGWSWWQPDLGGAVVVAPEIHPRPGFEAGYEIAPAYTPRWLSSSAPAVNEIAATGASDLILTPAWTLGANDPVPQFGFDPEHAPLMEDLARQIAAAQQMGLSVSLHPALISPDDPVDQWWSDAPRNGAWWTVWFERYRSFALTYAQLAQESGAAKLILGGPEVAPALPGGLLANGSPSGAPPDAEARWRALLDEVRQTYNGKIAFEIDFGKTLQAPPPFLDAVDEVHVYWHVPLTDQKDAPASDLQAAAFAALDGSLGAEPELKGKPLVLSVEYLSIDGGATGCAPLPDGTCRSPDSFDAGGDPDPDLKIDLDEQTQALNAVLLAAYSHENVTGFYARRYYPPVSLHDKSASVNGKPAGQMLAYWYSRLREP
jgi:hypothetical protein